MVCCSLLYYDLKKLSPQCMICDLCDFSDVINLLDSSPGTVLYLQYRMHGYESCECHDKRELIEASHGNSFAVLLSYFVIVIA